MYYLEVNNEFTSMGKIKVKTDNLGMYYLSLWKGTLSVLFLHIF